MEHLSRRTARSIDLLLLVSDPTQVGIVTAKRLSDLANELDLKVERRILLVNGARQGQEGRLTEMAAETGLPFLMLHEDEKVREAALNGVPLPGDGQLARELRAIIPELFPSSKRKEA
jgi:CO dehydrogenase maturation factor